MLQTVHNSELMQPDPGLDYYFWVSLHAIAALFGGFFHLGVLPATLIITALCRLLMSRVFPSRTKLSFFRHAISPLPIGLLIIFGVIVLYESVCFSRIEESSFNIFTRPAALIFCSIQSLPGAVAAFAGLLAGLYLARRLPRPPRTRNRRPADPDRPEER